jgi:hypothetical protein
MRVLLTLLLTLVAPAAAQAPSVSLQEAVQHAERYLRDSGVENAHRYLQSATWHFNHESPAKSCWSVIWDVAASPPITDSHLLVYVCADGTIRHHDDWA